MQQTDTTPLGIFLPEAFDDTVWPLVREQLARPGGRASSLDGVREELSIRDTLAGLAYALDQCDAVAMVSYLTDDCVWANPRGAYHGADAIRADFEHHFQVTPRRWHVWSNVVIRLADDVRSAGAVSNFFAVTDSDDRPPRAVGGLAVDELVKQDQDWKVAHRTTAATFVAPLALANGAH